MIEMLPAPDHVCAYRFSGTLTEEDVDRVIADIDARLARHEKLGIVADLTGFEDVSVRAGLKDLRYSFGKILEWNRFPREAIITDRHWLKTFASMAGPLLPFVALRAFGPEESEAAFAWAADIGAANIGAGDIGAGDKGTETPPPPAA
jgi:hypothetical protein